MRTLHENITFLCKERGVSGSRMCLDLGLSKSVLSDLKYGRKKGLSASTAQKMAAYLGVTINQLLGEEEPTENPAVIADNEVDAVTMELLCIINNGSDADRQDMLDMLRIFNKRREKR